MIDWCSDMEGLESLSASNIEDAPVGLAELAQMLMAVEVADSLFLPKATADLLVQMQAKNSGRVVSNTPFTSVYSSSHWSVLQATHPTMRVRFLLVPSNPLFPVVPVLHCAALLHSPKAIVKVGKKNPCFRFMRYIHLTM